MTRRTGRPAAPNRVTFGRPQELPDDPATVRRVVKLDGERVGVLYGERRASQGVYRSTRYSYIPDDATLLDTDTYSRIEEAREGIDRLHLGLPEL